MSVVFCAERCEDIDEKCAGYTKELCDNNANIEALHKKCPASCGICTRGKAVIILSLIHI